MSLLHSLSPKQLLLKIIKAKVAYFGGILPLAPTLQTGGGLTQQKSILSQLWSVEVQSQGVSRAVLSRKLYGGISGTILSQLPGAGDTPHCLLACTAHGWGPCLTSPGLLLSVCPCVLSSYKDACHWI